MPAKRKSSRNGNSTNNRIEDEEKEESEEFLDCEVHEESELIDSHGGNKFYAEVTFNGMRIKLGDFVKVSLEETCAGQPSTSICQVLALYDDVEGGSGIFMEARWFQTIAELSEKSRKILEQRLGSSPFRTNELIETYQLDDIPVGSILSKVRIIGCDDDSEIVTSSTHENHDMMNGKGGSGKRKHNENNEDGCVSTDAVYVTRFLESSGSSSFLIVRIQSILKRGVDVSHYQHVYADVIKTYDNYDGAMPEDIYSQAIRKLHISVLPDYLPCRSEEREKIQNLIREVIVNRDIGHAIYISGMPGTGKTATVLASIRSLVEEARNGSIPDFLFVEINCLRISQPAEAYTLLWRSLSGEFCSSKVALKQLSDFFSSQEADFKHEKHIRRPIACLIDELDFLITADEQVVYNFFDWSVRKECGLLLVGVSNIMDLPERLSARMNSRIKSNLKRLVFAPYDHSQVKEILLNRLGALELEIFKKQTVEFLARKASTVAGDVRAALKICQRAIELYLEDQSIIKSRIAADEKQRAFLISNGTLDPNTPVPAPPAVGEGISNMIVKKAADEYKENPMIATMRRACLLDKRILAAACKHVRLTGDSDVSVSMLWSRLCDLTSAVEAGRRLNGYTGRVAAVPPMSTFYEALQRMLGQGLLVSSRGLKGQRVREATGVMYLVIRLRSEMTDVIQAIKDDESLFLHYHLNDS